MLGFYIGLPFLLFALYRLFVVLYNYISRPFLPVGTPVDSSLVSILVYVQNSEKSIGKLLQGIKEQIHQNVEVLIYNDQSNDRSVDVISEASAGDKRFRLFNGSDVNNEWQRKNYAYDKLAQIAKGQYFMFVESDIVVDSQFIANAIAHVQRKSLSLLVVYPRIQSSNFLVRMRVYVVQWMFFTLLSTKPFLKKRVGKSSLFTNPVLLIEAANYQSNRWHDKFKDDEVFEFKLVDTFNGLSLEKDILLGDNSLVQEIADFNFKINQFPAWLIQDKNGLIVYTIAAVFGLFIAIFLLPFPLVFLYLFAIIYSRMLISIICQQSVIVSLLLMPIQFIIMVQILVNAIKKSRG